MQNRSFSRLVNRTSALACLLAVIAILSGSWKARAAASAAPGDRDSLASVPSATLNDHTPLQVLDGTAIRAGHYNPEQKLRLTLAVKPPHMEEEEQFLRELQTVGSPNFHNYLSSEEWDARFAPSVEDEQKVVDWALSQGLTVTHRFDHRLLVDLEAPAGVIEKAFGVTIDNYQVGEEVDFSNDRNPLLPSTLSGIVYSVQGLNNIQRVHGSKPGSETIKGPDYAPGPVYAEAGSDHGDGDPVKFHSNRATPKITNNFVDPSDLYSSQTYNFGALQNVSHCCNVHNDSTGSPPDTSIAIVEYETILGSDISGFAKQYGLSYNWSAINVDGTITCPKDETVCPGGEATEDVEWSIAMANNPASSNLTAHVWIYQAANGLQSTTTDMFGFMLSDGHARVFTTSYSCTENYQCSESTINSEHAIFNKMLGVGWTLIAASGDRGASDDCKDNLPAKPAPQLDKSAHTSVAYPASDFDFVAAGGTQLEVYTDGTWDFEHGWQGGTSVGSCASNGGGSGGGTSVYFDQPYWQNGLGGTMRLSPDLALNADGVGQNLYINGKLNGDANGTSVVAPELAGYFAQVNSYLNYIGHICGTDGTTRCEPIGNPNPYIYYEGMHKNAAHDPFYDMTSGCNSNDATHADKLKYFCAVDGYDRVTGWGSANMLQLAWAINWEIIPARGEPYITFTGPATNKWYNTNQTVNWVIHDYEPKGSTPGSGIAGLTQGWDSLPDDPSSEPHGGSGNSFYSGPQFPGSSKGCLAFEPNGCSGGVSQGCHTAYARGWNNQGWSTIGSSKSGYPESYGPICYDTVLPVTTISNNANVPASGWYNTPVTVTVTSTDPGGKNASGVAKSYLSINKDNCSSLRLGAPCVAYTAPVTVSAQGTQSVVAWSYDNAGNSSADATETVKIDTSAPVTTIHLAGKLKGTTYESAVTITLTAKDNLSGVKRTYYSENGGTVYELYSKPIAISKTGKHSVLVYSKDVAGNSEKPHAQSFTIAAPTSAN
jgi:hypothetical protein